MNKSFKLLTLIISIFFIFLFCSCDACIGDTSDHAAQIKKIKVGMTYEQVIKYMGETDYIDESSQYKVLYWFDGATDLEDIEAKSEKGAHMKYYCVIVQSSDYVNFTVYEAEDIFTGYWGKD